MNTISTPAQRIRNKLLQQLKKRYIADFNNWHTHEYALKWTGYIPVKMAEVLKTFGPFMLCVDDVFFIVTKRGYARVTAINDDGIRIQLIAKGISSQHYWVHTYDMFDWKLKELPPLI